MEGWRGPGRPLPPHFGETIQAGRLGKPGAGDALMALALDNPRYAYVYAVALNGLGKPDAALWVLGEAYRRHPYDREVLLGLASILRDQGRRKEATRYAEELVAVMPENAEAKHLLEEIRAKGRR